MNYVRLYRLVDNLTVCAYKTTSAKSYSQHHFRFHETQNMWRKRDGVKENFQLVYKAPMDTPIKFATTYLTFTTSIIGAAAVYYGAFVYDPATINNPVTIGDDIVIANSAIEWLTYLGAFIALHGALKSVLSKYVLRLYKDDDEYVAIFRGHLFNSTRQHQFNLKDCNKLNPTLIVPWNESRYQLGSKKGIILDNYFKSPEHLNCLLTKKKFTDDDE